MTEKQVRERLAQLEKELADEKAKNEQARQTIADLAKAAALGGPVAVPWPWPGPTPPELQPFAPLAPPFMAYAIAFADKAGPINPPTITYSGMLPTPKGKPPK